MNVFQAVILGIVQGLTEFIPVSSSGHLEFMRILFGIQEPSMMFDVFLHVGTLIPIFVVFWNEIFALIKKPFQKTTYLLVIGTIPAVVVTLLFGDFIENTLSGPIALAICFAITGIVLILSDRIVVGRKTVKEVTYVDALMVGCMQAFAIPAGISRSGSTITGSLLTKMNRETAAKFAFLLSIPAILGALVLQLKDLVTGEVLVESINWLNIGAGFMAAMLSGYLAIRFMITLIKKAKLKYFSIYVFALSIFLVVKTIFF